MIDLYSDVLRIAREYMGVVAERYLKRRCEALDVSRAAEMRPEHLEPLAQSIGMTAEVYMSQPKARQFKQDIIDLKKRYPEEEP